MNILRSQPSPRVQRQSKATLIAQDFALREKYQDALSRLSDCAAQRSTLQTQLQNAAETLVELKESHDRLLTASALAIQALEQASDALETAENLAQRYDLIQKFGKVRGLVRSALIEVKAAS